MFAKGLTADIGHRIQLYSTRTLAPLRLPEIALARVRPSARVAAEDVAQFVNYFSPNSLAPARKGLARRFSRALTPSIERASRQSRACRVFVFAMPSSVGGRLLNPP